MLQFTTHGGHQPIHPSPAKAPYSLPVSEERKHQYIHSVLNLLLWSVVLMLSQGPCCLASRHLQLSKSHTVSRVCYSRNCLPNFSTVCPGLVRASTQRPVSGTLHVRHQCHWESPSALAWLREANSLGLWVERQSHIGCYLDSGVTLTRFQFQLCHLLTVQLYSCNLTSLCLSFLIRKIDMVIIVPTS